MATTPTTINLVKHYFNICNTALLQKEDNLLYKVAMDIANQFASGDNITLKIVDEQGKPLEYYTAYFKDGQFAPIREGIHEPDAQFSLSKHFLEHVLENADDYIEHPRKLDWSWLLQSIKPS